MENRQWRIPFSGVGARYTMEEKQAVWTAMEATDTLTQGRFLQEFERKFSDLHQVGHSFAVSSCTAALELSAICLDLSPEDEVIIPAHTYCATAIPFARHGAKIVWADIDPHTFVVTPATLEPLITRRTKAIVCVHLYGLGAPMPDIMSMARSKGVLVVEDCAQALGARIGEDRVGSFGDFACFSFHTHKNISTLGEGGMLIVRDARVARAIPGLRHVGQRPYPAPRERYWVPAMSNVDFDFEGVWPHNFCIGDVQCALGVKLLDRVDAMIQDRKTRFLRFSQAFHQDDRLIVQKIPKGAESAHHLLPCRYKAGRADIHNDDFIQRMAEEHGVQCVVQYYPLNRYPLFSKAGFGEARIPHTDDLFDNMVSFPFHHWMRDQDFQYMISAARETLDYLDEER